MSPQISYFFKKIYGNIIKWWFVIYNPVARRIWPTKEEEEQALAAEQNTEEIDEEEQSTNSYNDFMENEADYAVEDDSGYISEEPDYEEPESVAPTVNISDSNYNATTGAYSGLYGTGPVDSNTQSMLDEIMGRNNAAHSIDSLLPGNEPDFVEPVEEDPETSKVLAEANEIYERLMREAAEDEAKKQAEIDAAKAAQM